MKTRSLSIKIPLKVANSLDERGRLNPSYIISFIVTHLSYVNTIKDKPINGLTYNYTMKVNIDLHKAIKMIAVEEDLPINEMVGRLLNYYYKE